MKQPTLRTIAALALLAGTAAGQVVWPPGTSGPGNDKQDAPFTTWSVSGSRTRSMALLDGASFASLGIGTVQKLSFRRDGVDRTTTYPSQSGRLRLEIGEVRSVADATTTFARNWVGTPLLVFDGQVSLPNAPPPPGTAAAPWVGLPFSMPWRSPGGHVGIDMLWESSAQRTWSRDAVTIDRGAAGTFRSIGGGCRASNGFEPSLYVAPATAVPGLILEVGMWGAPVTSPTGAQMPAAHLFGGALPAPLTLAPSLASGCWLRLAQVGVQFVPTWWTTSAWNQPNGPSTPYPGFVRGVAWLPLPNSPAFQGRRLISQWLAPDLGTRTPLSFVVSDAIEITLGNVDPRPGTPIGRTIWLYGARGDALDAGHRAPGDYVPVLGFN
jgi:hypothetical protein